MQSPPTPLSLPLTMASTGATYNRKTSNRRLDKNYNNEESWSDRISDALKIVQFNDAHLDPYYKEVGSIEIIQSSVIIIKFYTLLGHSH